MRFSHLLFPDVCPFCRRLLDRDESYVCLLCRQKIPYILGATCLKCGKKVEFEQNEMCRDCTKNTRSYEMGFPAMEYNNMVREGVMLFKYGNKRGLARYFASEIVKAHGSAISGLGVEALIPVPVHKKRLKHRGYNQAALLAYELSDYLGVPVDEGILLRQKKTAPQKELNDIEREKNLKRAFNSGQKIVEYKRVMIVDDIYTTGATVESCTSVLKGLNISKVYYTSICIGKGC